MRFGITSRLFATILVTNVAIALVFAVATQLGVDRSFRSYVEQREERRLQQLALTFAATYREQGTWDFVRESADEWQRLRRSDRPPKPAAGEPPPAGLSRPPIKPRPPDEGRGPPPGMTAPAGRMFGEPLPGAGDFERRAGGPPPLTLLDRDRSVLKGTPLPSGGPALAVPVVVDGATVGWLAVPELPFGGSDHAFLRRQLELSGLIGAFAILLAAGVAIVLARGFLAPLRQLANATHRLAAGHYDERLSTKRSDELGQLIADFNRLASTLQQSEQTRRGFLADVSHELRTPVAILKGELEALQDGVRSLTPEAIRSLQSEIATLTALIDDLYDLAVADLGVATLVIEEVDLAALVRATLHAFADRFAQRALAVDASGIVPASAPMQGDVRRLTQLLNNLLENTLRYTDPGGRVAVSLEADAHKIRLAIEDTAPGVPTELLPRLFERLFRVEASRSRALGGAGLGLALCRSIVEGHGGEIAARGSPLGGLRIDVTLPVSR